VYGERLGVLVLNGDGFVCLVRADRLFGLVGGIWGVQQWIEMDVVRDKVHIRVCCWCFLCRFVVCCVCVVVGLFFVVDIKLSNCCCCVDSLVWPTKDCSGCGCVDGRNGLACFYYT
jgi:hypothetical protein